MRLRLLSVSCFRFALLLLSIGSGTLAITAKVAKAEWHQNSFHIMGTLARVELWSPDKELAKSLLDETKTIIEAVNQEMSPYIESSALYRLNEKAAEGAQVVSPELFELLRLSKKFSEKTQGAFDITFASVGYLYEYREGKQPEQKDIDRLKDAINYQGLILTETNRSVKFSDPRIKIDLGGIAKGHAVDRCIDLLKRKGIKHGIVQIGGDSRIIGNRRGRPWLIGIKHPRQENQLVSKIPLENIAVSTSGDYERFFIDKKGQRIHHIIDPQNGQSARRSQSVTILASNSTLADALSTSLFVMGFERGLKLINQLENVSAIIIDAQGKMHYSKDLLLHQ